MHLTHYLFSFFFLVSMSSPLHAAISGECGSTTEAIATRFEHENKKHAKMFKEMVPVPDRSKLINCLNGISIGDSMSLGLPSIGDLFNQMCNMANDAIGDQISKVQRNIKFEPVPGVVLSAGKPLSQTSIGDFSIKSTDAKFSLKATDHSRQILKRITPKKLQ